MRSFFRTMCSLIVFHTSLMPKRILFILCRMFQPDKYPGLDEFYEQKHSAVLVKRGEVLMMVLMIIFLYSMIFIL